MDIAAVSCILCWWAAAEAGAQRETHSTQGNASTRVVATIVKVEGKSSAAREVSRLPGGLIRPRN